MVNDRPDAGLAGTFHRFVVPGRRHLTLLHGNVLWMGEAERAGMGSALAEDAVAVTDGELEQLLADDWRAQLTAAWLAAFDRRHGHRERIGELLLASRVTYAGQGFCFALARFGTPRDAELLVAYLDRYLPRLDLVHDQPWALGALLHLDARLGSDRAGRFLAEGGAWRRWANAAAPKQADPDDRRALVDRLCAFADECMRTVTGPGGPRG